MFQFQMPDIRNVMPKIVWISLVLALGASLGHVAWSFGVLEFANGGWQGWMAAVAVDIGIVSLTYGIRLRKQARRKTDDSKRGLFRDQDGTRGLKFGVGFLVFISIAANTLHGLAVSTGGSITLGGILKSVQADPLSLVRVFIFAATLPVMVVYLSDIVSADDERAAKKNEQADERVQKLKDDLNTFRERAEQDRGSLVQTIQSLNTQLNERSVEIERLNTLSIRSEQNGWHEEWASYMAEHPNATQREMAEHFGVSVGTVNTRLRKLNQN